MVKYLSILLFIIFLILSMLHFYWALGGTWGAIQAIPTDESGNLVLQPNMLDSVVVGLGLLFFGATYLLQSGVVVVMQLLFVLRIMGWIIPLIFLARAVGDFTYVGFFKSITTTDFAYWDTILFSPLCLLLSLCGFIILKRR